LRKIKARRLRRRYRAATMHAQPRRAAGIHFAPLERGIRSRAQAAFDERLLISTPSDVCAQRFLDKSRHCLPLVQDALNIANGERLRIMADLEIPG